MKTNKLILATILSLFVAPSIVRAGEGHNHDHDKPALEDKSVVETRGKEELKRLLAKGKVDASWKDVSAVKSVEKKSFGKKWEWVVIFENPAAKEDKLLYVFLKASGEFLAANHSGK